MNRNHFHRLFKCPGPVILPVIHVLTEQQTLQNIKIAINEGAQGTFLINHDFAFEQLLPIIANVRQTFPGLWLGVNFLAVTGRDAFPVLGNLASEGHDVDAYWADDARIVENATSQMQPEAQEIDEVRARTFSSGMYFGGTAFKKQREINPQQYQVAATNAAAWMDVVTTSGTATGEAAGLDKIKAFRHGIVDKPLAVASGITPDNATDYAPYVDAFLVATGINMTGDFYNIDAAKLAHLIARCRHWSSQTSVGKQQTAANIVTG